MEACRLYYQNQNQAASSSGTHDGNIGPPTATGVSQSVHRQQNLSESREQSLTQSEPLRPNQAEAHPPQAAAQSALLAPALSPSQPPQADIQSNLPVPPAPSPSQPHHNPICSLPHLTLRPTLPHPARVPRPLLNRQKALHLSRWTYCLWATRSSATWIHPGCIVTKYAGFTYSSMLMASNHSLKIPVPKLVPLQIQIQITGGKGIRRQGETLQMFQSSYIMNHTNF